ncbi:MAG TPA: Cof-type HAD-IIB family hydrolase [Desulfosporosinus sp.]
MENRLYISDLDGTLLRNDARLSDYSKTKIQELVRKGVHFSVASARSVVAIQKMFEGVKLNLPVVEFNGAFITDLSTGYHEVINDIDKSIASEILSLSSRQGWLPFVSSFNGTEDCLYYGSILNEGMEWYLNDRKKAHDRRLREVSDLQDSLNDNIVCFTIIGREEHLAEVQLKIYDRFKDLVELHLMENPYSPGWYWLTAHDYRATKDQAIKIILDRLGITPNKLTVFGDNSNDLKMFKLAGKSIAVNNATDELKSYASEVIGSNEEDSVVKYIVHECS